MNNRNLGKFSISRHYLDKLYPIVQAIMCEVVVVRAEYMFESDAIEYIAISADRFRKLKDGESVPFYKVKFNEHGLNFLIHLIMKN